MAVAPLRALHAAGYDIALVVTNADARRGRGTATSPTPVKAAATELGLPVSHTVDDALDVDADLGVVVAFGRLIRPHVLASLPMVNLHFSLLPRWRGAAPVERAILAGDDVTGVDVMAVDETLDTGAIYAEREVAIGPDETAEALRARLVEVGTELLVATLADGLADPRAQVGQPVYAEKLTADDRHIEWAGPAVQVHRVVRVGGAWTTWRGARCKVWRTALVDVDVAGVAPGEVLADGGRVLVACGDARAIELLELQPEGKARQAATAWRNGARPDPGERFT